MQHKIFADKQAIVIGASIGGLLAARALADQFEQVTLLERDSFPAAGEQRKGVPQGRHAHGVLARGLQIMEDYFPGLTERLIELGADYGDVSAQARWFHEGGYHRPGQCGIHAINISRPRLEAEVRARVLALPNVQVLEGCDVLGLLTTVDKTRVIGVRLIRRKADSAAESKEAHLVVDASGRGSRSPAWLADLGYARPNEETVQIGVSYASCTYQRCVEHIPGISAVIVAASPKAPRSGVLLSQEGNRWILTVAAYLGEQIPLDHAGLLAYVREMADPTLYSIIANAEPLEKPVAYKVPSNLRRRYEQLKNFPQGYLVFGDAICSFNPIYAQGMSVAAQEALLLAACLRAGEVQLSERFFQRVSKLIDNPWQIAVGNDLRLPGVKGPRPVMTRFINWYMSRLHHAAQRDATLSIAFLKVVNMVASPPSVMQPRIVWRVLWGNLWP